MKSVFFKLSLAGLIGVVMQNSVMADTIPNL